MDKNLRTLIIVALAVGLLSAVLTLVTVTRLAQVSGELHNQATPAGFGAYPNSFSSVYTSSTSVGSGTSTVVLAENRQAVYRLIVNDGPSTVYAKLGTGVTTGTGFPIAVNGSFEINLDNLYVGNISLIASGTTSSVRTAEK